MMSKSEAQDILLEYLEEMMPMMVGEYMSGVEERIKEGGERWPFDVQSVFYEPFITEKLTKEKLDKINKTDNNIFIVVDGGGDFAEWGDVNYWILAPYKTGFVWVNRGNIKTMGIGWGEMLTQEETAWFYNLKDKNEGEYEELERWRKFAKSQISNYHKNLSTLRQILYEGLNPKDKAFYILNPSVSSPSRTLNFSRRGFL